VSSPEAGEPPYPERYRVPASTAHIVNAVRGRGGRVIAVGTTVVRALETVAQRDGSLVAGEGWTNHIVCAECRVRVVDGLITGWHEPEASHLQMLRAIADEELLERCYREALARGSLWQEFGDSHLILPYLERKTARRRDRRRPPVRITLRDVLARVRRPGGQPLRAPAGLRLGGLPTDAGSDLQRRLAGGRLLRD